MKRMGWVLAVLALAGGCRRGEAATVRRAEEGRAADDSLTQPAQQVACGRSLCALGEVCCNPSCGICTERDGMCTQQFCDDVAEGTKAGEPLPPAPRATCETVRCRDGLTCVMVQVQCVRAPCERVPRCVAPDELEAGVPGTDNAGSPRDAGSPRAADAQTSSATLRPN